MLGESYAQASWRPWDDRYADHVISKRNWQIAALGSMLVSLVLAAIIVWLAGRSRYIPYVVEVDKLGYGLTLAQPLTPAAAPDAAARMERYEIAMFVREAREVSSDPQAEQERLNALLAHARGAADHFLDEYYHADSSHNPFEIARKQTVTVAIDSILQLSPQSYEVRWSEQRRDLNGAALGQPEHWEAELETEIVPPRDAGTIVSNPLGFYVDRMSWTQAQS
ncbi:MAG TPA: VirB8/TrbF family protein [Candidatus Binataceae bacterium]|nr:VirB8/TrbF family protein [Candidatus Binataceae bacterium]